MNVSYYCQHVLGIGHIQRSLEICETIAKTHSTTLILGGPPVEISHPELKIVQLPGLQMDSSFQNLQPCESGLSLEETKQKRQQALFNHFQEDKPDVFITELYPFGRKAFKFELDPVLTAIKEGQLNKCLCVCSVRDILVEKETDRDKFENRVVDTINSYFDGILVHADPMVITLDQTFGQMRKINVPLYYTGYVTKTESIDASLQIREKRGITKTDNLIVASIGGGNVGAELLTTTIDAIKMLQTEKPTFLQVFCGPYCAQETYNCLKRQENHYVTVERFSKHFSEWLQTADLSISMAGYNTSMNLVFAGIPSLVYPFAQNREQRLRAEKLAMFSPMGIIKEIGEPEKLAAEIQHHLQLTRVAPQIDLNGAERSAQQIQSWFTSLQKND